MRWRITIGADECARMSITERIIEIFEDVRTHGTSDRKIDEALLQIGCTRVVRRSSMVIVYYDDDGVERFVVLCGP
jgi:hypothetical protein